MLKNLWTRFYLLLNRRKSKKRCDKDTSELCYLMDQVTNARRVAKEYRRMIRKGAINPYENIDDAGGSWLEVEDRLMRRDYIHAFGFLTIMVTMAVMLGAFGYISIQYSQEKLLLNKVAEARSKSSVRLKLSDGREVPFQNKDTISITMSTLKVAANNRSMHIVSTGGGVAGMNELQVPARLDYTVILPDGSSVRLNASTTLRFPAAFGSTRTVYLDGEAYFKIADDPQHPFTVYTPGNTIHVLGTEFNVNTYDHTRIKTSLVKGAVDVVQHNQHTLLRPGKEAVFSGRHVSMNSFEKPNALSWMNGKFYFHDMQLSEVTAMIPRWFDVKVVFDDPMMAHEKYTGCLDKLRRLDSFMEALKSTGTLDYYFTDDVLHITSPGA
ncbi:MAG TPA: FecR domain-containing protein [Chitinophaga sp.]|uniref:FecR family protein n=1 Tax=Chitinophaga sp. TaxID=1869181 RepID=UPI002C5B321F|nr:FecR domain-containing protein [Chitinophaga sp.]HVI47744.1 FecR domain-containing protein [Chitinophaga sp.]